MYACKHMKLYNCLILKYNSTVIQTVEEGLSKSSQIQSVPPTIKYSHVMNGFYDKRHLEDEK